MERPESRSSGLPRVSRLPQGRSALPQATQPTPVANTSAIRPARRNTVEMPAVAARAPPPGTATPAAAKRQSMLVRPGALAGGLRSPEATGIMSPPLSTGIPGRPPSSFGRPLATEIEASESTLNKGARRSRPSLSDRTADTLSQIPPSPASRRQSAFYGAESPLKIRPPSRAESALGHNRPTSRIGSVTGIRPPDRPVSPAKPRALPGESRGTRPGSIVQPKRGVPTPGKSAIPSNGIGSNANKIHTLRSPVKSNAKEQFGGPLPSPPKLSGRLGLSRPKEKSSGPAQSNPRVGEKEEPSEPAAVLDPPQASPDKSSSALRQAIAQAKALHQSPGHKANASVPRAAVTNNFASFGPDTDPMTLDLVDSAHINILKKRLSNASTSGTLNIAALCLTTIPTEVLHMHESDLAGVPWYERVNLTRLLASDNEFKELPAELFPSAPLVEDDEPNTPPPTGPFPLLDTLDLHGNQLESLPMTLTNLMKLENLNLGGNRLSPEGTWDVITQMLTQKRLELGKNRLDGPMPTTIASLVNLEFLDVHENAITDIPAVVGNLIRLKHVDVSKNKLESIPFEGLFDLPLAIIQASQNRLAGSLLPKTVPMFESLVELDVSNNNLSYLSEGDLKLPNLRRLNVSYNRIVSLPNMETWQALTEINAEENKISALPEGFAKLKALATANFVNNSLLTIDHEIGFMDKLVRIDFRHNPIRERMLLKLNTEELKAELRSLHAAETATESAKKPATIRGFGTIGSPTSPTSTPWVVSGGTIDRSNTRLLSIDAATVEAIADQSVKSLVLHHNSLQVFSPAIELLGGSLTTLDLANNKLGKSSTYLSAALCLPNLQSLNLTSNILTTLEPLTTHLSADRLSTLIVPFNRLTTLPTLTTAFPALKKLIVSNNKVTVLDVASVRGLEVLDISSNDLEALPPQLGLLQGQLRTLMVGANKFRAPGWGVLEKGTDEILKWCKNRLPESESDAATATTAAKPTTDEASATGSATAESSATLNGLTF